MPFVLDASMTLAWCFEDEANPYADTILDRLTEDTAVVPAIWSLEVANVLMVSRRRGRTTREHVREVMGLLVALPIIQETALPTHVFESVLPLGEELGLSAYDTSYLELARRQGLLLATLDERLRTSARIIGVGLLETA